MQITDYHFLLFNMEKNKIIITIIIMHTSAYIV